MASWLDSVRAWTTELVALPSVTGSIGETSFAHALHEKLRNTPYFGDHPDDVWVARTTDDLRERYNVWALVRGNGPQTVVMSGHYDVVAIDNYGDLAPWAYAPDELLPRLIADLRANAQTPGDRGALHEFESGDYLPGRGALDMKSGLAAGLAVLQHWADQPERAGNLLFVATPDEEVASHGMRAAARQLHDIVRARGLEIRAAINLDASGERDDQGAGRAIFLGTVGKLLPAVYIVGRETHAGSPFAGLNAALLAAEITRAIEGNVELADAAEGAVAPPPVCLKQTDLKDHYDVTTPTACWCYYNILTHGRSPVELLERLHDIVGAALERAVAHMEGEAQRWFALAQLPYQTPHWQPRVISYAELHTLAIERSGVALGEELETLAQAALHEKRADLPTLSRMIVERVWQRSGLLGPAAVVCVGSLFYPATLVRDETARGAAVLAAARKHALALGAEHGIEIALRPFFPGISDMSFLGNSVDAADRQALHENTPAWNYGAAFDHALLRDLPTINIGPWGRDYHQRTERVNMPYSFAIVPELIWRVAGDLLSD